MTKAILLGIFTLLTFTCQENQETSEEIKIETKLTVSDIEKIVLDKEKDALNNWSNGSVLGYTKHFADDVVYIDDIAAHDGVSGIEAAQAYAKSIDSTGMIKKHNYELKNTRVQVVDNNAILSLQYHPTSLDGTPGTSWKASIVYSQRESEWKVIHANWSFYKKE